VIIYTFDTSLSPRLTGCLRMLLPEDGEPLIVVKHDVIHISEEAGFEPEKGIAPFLPTLAKQQRILVTCLSASKRKLVNEALAECRLSAVHLADSFSSLSVLLQASKLIASWEHIVEKSYRLRDGACVSVSANGKVT